MKPVIGITATPSRDETEIGTFERYGVSSTYVNAVLAAGGIPVVLPPLDAGGSDLVESLDGLLLSGGSDLAPERYGDSSVHPATYGIHPSRDAFELELLDIGLRQHHPILCICRGIQTLNVGLGGTLVQHIPDQITDALEHRQQNEGLGIDEIGHRVHLEPDSVLEAAYGGTTVGVNSFHHQALGEVATDLAVIGRAPDGVVEAVVMPGKAFVVGVQWHPEMMFARHPSHLAPFRALVEAASARRLTMAT
ncbi:MAG: Glutamine amidotransferase, class I [uncultured Thermomicrobiales bacterium]|uniref:Glutamine amidotransferase, class I n=1 Tax=uncultured Thermomicrobiales bacterium TaxID=1645740 RepID=A0A6J4VJI3_9BACT|nr:MAG: Glutamine amidotransferase, class I [uncultured Thermomicrobiales bacterium]